MAAAAADGEWIDVSGDGGLLKKVCCGVANGEVGRRVGGIGGRRACQTNSRKLMSAKAKGERAKVHVLVAEFFACLQTQTQ